MKSGNYTGAILRCLTGIIFLAVLSGQGALAAANDEPSRPVNPRMANSASPYLKIHATDLVQWYTWSDETFELARKLNRPLMVSFGYTACHWCHVMQETHFTQSDIAKTINENFIPVVVDRERRPVLDETYMLVTEVLTKRGGWPNTVFMTADRKPFYGTGYISADSFRQILTAVSESWNEENAGVYQEAERLSGMLQTYLNRKREARLLDDQLMASSADALAAEFDEFVGGFGGAPKFFQQSILMFLLQQGERTYNKAALAAVELTLRSVISGGIHDQIEGGLHRYAIDPNWRIPHFEKMLYDQATMAEVFVEAYRITGKTEYGAMGRRIIDYVLADLTAPSGGFYSTRDADSEGEEGTYYIWSVEQFHEILGADDEAYAVQIFEQVADGELVGKIILNRDLIEDNADPRVKLIFAKLAEARKSRVKPQRDEKIVVSWNGMMISAMANAALVLEDQRYTRAALKAGQFLWDNLRLDDDQLLRVYFDGKADLDATLLDYAHLGRAFVKLYDMTGDGKWLQRAKGLLVTMESRFADPDVGDFYSTSSASGFGRMKSRQDSDLASGNAVALDLTIALARRDGDPQRQRRVEQLLSVLSGFAADNPATGASILMAADRFANGGFGPVQIAGGGNVRVQARLQGQKIIVQLDVAEGWHVNADKPLEEYLIPTSLAVPGMAGSYNVSYPKPQLKQLGFSNTPLALLEGSFEISLDSVNGNDATNVVELEIQACSDRICLAPDTLKFRVVAPLKGG